jgi:phosphoglucomutase
LSAPAQRTALEVLTANDIETFIQRDDAFTQPCGLPRYPHLQPRAQAGLADGIDYALSNLPEDGGYKYNLPNGGPPTKRHLLIRTANDILRSGNREVRRRLRGRRRRQRRSSRFLPYVKDRPT